MDNASRIEYFTLLVTQGICNGTEVSMVLFMYLFGLHGSLKISF